LLNALETEYSSKRFNTVGEIRDRLVLVLKLDPLPNITEDEKMGRLQQKGITLETYVISSNIQEFIQRAIIDEPKFAQLDTKAQKEKMKAYATELIASQSMAAEVLGDETDDTDPFATEPPEDPNNPDPNEEETEDPNPDA
jgi:hypothetical protein